MRGLFFNSLGGHFYFAESRTFSLCCHTICLYNSEYSFNSHLLMKAECLHQVIPLILSLVIRNYRLTFRILDSDSSNQSLYQKRHSAIKNSKSRLYLRPQQQMSTNTPARGLIQPIKLQPENVFK